MNYVISICGPESLNTLTSICRDLKLPLSVILLGEGTASRGMLDILGIESNEKRVLITVANEKKTKKLKKYAIFFASVASYPWNCISGTVS